MKPAPFEYRRPSSVDEALEQLADSGDDAKVLAGGQSLIPSMNFRLAQPGVLIDLNGIGELDYINRNKGELTIGAMTRQRTVERNKLILQHDPLLADAMPLVAHPQIRNRGTMGGSIAHADPAAELPAVMLARQAQFRVRNRTNARNITAADFFVGLFTTSLDPDELLIEIRLPPLPPNSGCAFMEISRRHGDYALVGVAAVVTLDSNGQCTDARIGLLSVGDGPVLAGETEKVLLGTRPTQNAIEAAANTAAYTDVDPPSDIHASAAYRRQLVKVLTRRTLCRAFARATEKGR